MTLDQWKELRDAFDALPKSDKPIALEALIARLEPEQIIPLVTLVHRVVEGQRKGQTQ